jgi:hypothetical protein
MIRSTLRGRVLTGSASAASVAPEQALEEPPLVLPVLGSLALLVLVSGLGEPLLVEPS